MLFFNTTTYNSHLQENIYYGKAISDFQVKYGTLVGGLEHFLFFHILGIATPTDELIFFRGVAQPPTRSLLTINIIHIIAINILTININSILPTNGRLFTTNQIFFII